jgi:predicted transcriptional regulator
MGSQQNKRNNVNIMIDILDYQHTQRDNSEQDNILTSYEETNVKWGEVDDYVVELFYV